MLKKLINFRMLLFILILLFTIFGQAQNTLNFQPKESVYNANVTRLWINTYGNIRISKNLFWVAQTHLRFQETESTPFLGKVAQVYNRHGLGYIYSDKINFVFGGVLRLNFNITDVDEKENLIPEYRIWHQYQFAMDIGRAVAFHRFRIEHRWSKAFQENSDYIFRNRWRYMFRLKIPINKPKIESKAFYIAPELELIMQSGKAVVGSPLDDLRLQTTVGYIFSPKITLSAGLMYSQGQTLMDGAIWNQGLTFRAHLYFSPDFRKVKNRIPEVHFRD